MHLPAFLLEDHKYVTEAYITALRSIFFGGEIVTSYSLNEAFQKINDPDLKELQLAILDYSMPHCQLNNLRNG